MKPQLKDQFVFPTLMQDHETGNFETVIGRRNLVTTSEVVFNALCSNGSIVDWATLRNRDKQKMIAEAAVSMAKLLLAEVDKNIS